MPCMSHGCPWSQHLYSDHPHRGQPFPPHGLGTMFCRGSTSLNWMMSMGPQLWDGVCHGIGFVGPLLWDGICCEMVSLGPLLMGQALPTPGWVPPPHSWWQPGLHGLGSPTPCLPWALLPSLTQSHPPLLTSVVHLHHISALPRAIYAHCAHSAPGQVLAPGDYSPIPAACSPGRVLAPALAPLHHRYTSTLGVLLPVALPQLPSGETCREDKGCLGKQALALAGHPGKIKTSGRAAMQQVREAGTP